MPDLSRPTWIGSDRPLARLVGRPLARFLHIEAAGGLLLLAATVAALVWANSPWQQSYHDFWSTEAVLRVGSFDLTEDLRHWVDDGLMAVFFFVVGLEIKRELVVGDLSDRRDAVLPAVAALGGMVVPALIYVAVNAGGSGSHGWGVPMATDIAFAVGVLALLGDRVPASGKVLLLALAIVDDIGAIVVIAVVYSDALALGWLAAAMVGLLVMVALRRARVWYLPVYVVLGIGVWLCTFESGVHATIAGVAIGLITPARPLLTEPEADDIADRLSNDTAVTAEEVRQISFELRESVSLAERIEDLLHPWSSYVIVPIFALANAGVTLEADVLREVLTQPIFLGIVVGLVVGKPVGIVGMTWLVSRPRFGGFPRTVPWPPLVGAATVAGIGFTVSLLIADISFEGVELEEAKLGILAASIVASLLGWIAFSVIHRLPAAKASKGADGLAPPILDLTDDVDPDVDHIRGPLHAPVTLVEYGDFECPYCGQAEPVVRELVQAFGDDLRFVFRHLPLVDVHEHAELAAEAAEAAASQGRFWEMHDRMMDNQASLIYPDLMRYAADLGLDVDRFGEDLRSRRYAARIHRDIDSADASGAAGTPTMFVNGRRHEGAHDIEGLAAAIERELAAGPS